MSTRLLESFGAYASAQVPAVNLWTSGANVTIGAGEGRSGESSDNAAFFSTALGSVLRRSLDLVAVDDIYTATWGQAFRLVSVAGDATLASIDTAISQFNLITDAFGALRLQQVVGGVVLGNILTTVAGTVPVGTGGFYVEVQIIFILGLAKACKLLVSDQYGEMNLVGQGALLALAAGDALPAVTFRQGGGTDDAVATWWTTDIYLTDGQQVLPPLAYNGRLIYNDGFLGNLHVGTFYPTADGLNLSSGNLPWVPNAGSIQYDRIDEHPPDEGATYLEGTEADQTTAVFYANVVTMLGRQGCLGYAPIFSIQWQGRASGIGAGQQVAAIIRRIITGIIASDDVYESAPHSIATEEFLYYVSIFDRNHANDDTPWTFAIFNNSTRTLPGAIEFGARVK